MNVHPMWPKPISIITLSSLLIFVSVCYCEDDKTYTECKSTFKCGNLEGLFYPFWSDDRPKVCGQDGFKLRCEDGQLPYITISDQEFRVTSIEPNQNMMTIARADYWGVLCPQNVVDTIDLTGGGLFNISPDVLNISFFYDCPNKTLAPVPPENHLLSCSSGNGPPHNDFYATDDLLKQWNVMGTDRCLQIVKIPFPSDDLEEILSGVEALKRVLEQGFTGWYKLHQDCIACHLSGGICGTNTTTSNFTCLCRDQPHELICSDSGNGPKLRLSIVGDIVLVGVIGILIGTCIVILCFKNKSSWKINKNSKDLEAFIKSHGPLPVNRYSFSQIKKITNHFKDKLGQGGYGSVYKGKLFDGRFVAVKILNISKGEGQEFINEVASISRTSHVNVVTLLGFCLEGEKRVLVYELMVYGSLDKFICYKSSLNNLLDELLEWKIMYQIAIGIARGLEYLHRGCNTRIVHFDIKPHNILLDENFCPKISDFGLAKLYTRQESIMSMTEARGTIGYIAPEVFSKNFGKVSYKSDVYSYGMMILEMTGGKRKGDIETDHTSEYFPDWIYKRLELGNDISSLYDEISMEDNEMVRKMTLVGLWCIQINPSDRPSMSKVIEMLQGSIEALQIPPKPFLHSSSRPLTSSSATSFILTE